MGTTSISPSVESSSPTIKATLLSSAAAGGLSVRSELSTLVDFDISGDLAARQ